MFSNCRTIGSGGAVNMTSGSNPSATFVGCTFSDNQSSSNGGAIEASAFGSVQLMDCTFLRNSTTFNGGAIDAPNATINMFSSLCAGNSASTGGALYLGYYTRISGCTFAANSGSSGPGRAIYANTGSSFTFENNIVWGTTGGSPSLPAMYPPFLSGQNNDVEGGLASGVGNINADPMFVNAAAGDYHLAPGSPCIDAGNSLVALFGAGAFDLEGHARMADDPGAPNVGVPYLNGAIVDMGCYERQAPPACAADFNHSGTLTVQDIFDYLAAWFAGCP
jgi:predicted outer membrane repeat protein